MMDNPVYVKLPQEGGYTALLKQHVAEDEDSLDSLYTDIVKRP